MWIRRLVTKHATSCGSYHRLQHWKCSWCCGSTNKIDGDKFTVADEEILELFADQIAQVMNGSQQTHTRQHALEQQHAETEQLQASMREAEERLRAEETSQRVSDERRETSNQKQAKLPRPCGCEAVFITSLEDVFRTVIDAAKSILDAERATLFLVSEDGSSSGQRLQIARIRLHSRSQRVFGPSRNDQGDSNIRMRIMTIVLTPHLIANLGFARRHCSQLRDWYRWRRSGCAASAEQVWE